MKQFLKSVIIILLVVHLIACVDAVIRIVQGKGDVVSYGILIGFLIDLVFLIDEKRRKERRSKEKQRGGSEC